MDDFRRALGFLTIYPLRATDTWTPEALGRSMAYYPLVGLCLGLALWLLYLLLQAILPRALTMVLLLGGLTVSTGGLHLDGLADTVDGLSRGKNREDSLHIFKDPHVGAVAVAAIVLVLLLQYASLQALPHQALLPTLVVMSTLSRYSMVQLACFSRYARASGGLGEPFVRGIQGKHLYTAAFFTVGIACLFRGWHGLLLWGLISLGTRGYQIYFHRRLGGITGDILGATNALNEVLVLLCMTILYR